MTFFKIPFWKKNLYLKVFFNILIFFHLDGENPVKSEGTMIDWNEGKNVTKK